MIESLKAIEQLKLLIMAIKKESEKIKRMNKSMENIIENFKGVKA